MRVRREREGQKDVRMRGSARSRGRDGEGIPEATSEQQELDEIGGK